MQTFLPSSNFIVSAKMLDSKRLNKQILEGYQILNVLSEMSKGNGWKNHPAVKMWRGHEMTLLEYIKAMINEAKKRGIKTDKNEQNIISLFFKASSKWGKESPSWMHDRSKLMRIITTHKANLFDKDPVYYYNFNYAKHSIFNQPCCPTCKYYWVTHEEK